MQAKAKNCLKFKTMREYGYSHPYLHTCRIRCAIIMWGILRQPLAISQSEENTIGHFDTSLIMTNP